jgi:hypothetical protein
VAKIDAESIEVSSIEAKTTEPLDTAPAAVARGEVAPVGVARAEVARGEVARGEVAPVGRMHGEDGAVEAPALAAGSQRISQHDIAVVELAEAEAGAAIAEAEAGAASELASDRQLVSEQIASTIARETASTIARETASTIASDTASTIARQTASTIASETASTIARETASTSTCDGELSEPDVITSAGTWQPTMPPMASTPSVPWRRPSLPTTTASTYVVPTLVIDDADPDSADRERDDRNAKEPHRLSFLPPILLDREDRSARQGGLTLAVIILLIAATLTLSYLMRRPSPSGDGVTSNETPASLFA